MDPLEKQKPQVFTGQWRDLDLLQQDSPLVTFPPFQFQWSRLRVCPPPLPAWHQRGDTPLPLPQARFVTEVTEEEEGFALPFPVRLGSEGREGRECEGSGGESRGGENKMEPQSGVGLGNGNAKGKKDTVNGQDESENNGNANSNADEHQTAKENQTPPLPLPAGTEIATGTEITAGIENRTGETGDITSPRTRKEGRPRLLDPLSMRHDTDLTSFRLCDALATFLFKFDDEFCACFFDFSQPESESETESETESEAEAVVQIEAEAEAEAEAELQPKLQVSPELELQLDDAELQTGQELQVEMDSGPKPEVDSNSPKIEMDRGSETETETETETEVEETYTPREIRLEIFDGRNLVGSCGSDGSADERERVREERAQRGGFVTEHPEWVVRKTLVQTQSPTQTPTNTKTEAETEEEGWRVTVS